jgi:hypothetical protein
MPDWEIEYKAWQWERAKRYLKPVAPEMLQPDSTRAGASETDMEWQPAPEVTEADRTHDTRSLNRALTKRLYLLLKRQGGLPQHTSLLRNVMGIPCLPHCFSRYQRRGPRQYAHRHEVCKIFELF